MNLLRDGTLVVDAVAVKDGQVKAEPRLEWGEGRETWTFGAEIVSEHVYCRQVGDLHLEELGEEEDDEKEQSQSWCEEEVRK